VTVSGTTKGQIMEWFIGIVALAIFLIMATTDVLLSSIN
jgi:hypothetical protein